MTYDRLLRQVWIRYTIFPSIFQLYCVMFACDRWSIINVTNAYIRFDLVVSLFTTFYEICSHKRTWSFFFQLKYQTVPYGQLILSNMISLFWFDFLLIASNHKKNRWFLSWLSFDDQNLLIISGDCRYHHVYNQCSCQFNFI